MYLNRYALGTSRPRKKLSGKSTPLSNFTMKITIIPVPVDNEKYPCNEFFINPIGCGFDKKYGWAVFCLEPTYYITSSVMDEVKVEKSVFKRHFIFTKAVIHDESVISILVSIPAADYEGTTNTPNHSLLSLC